MAGAEADEYRMGETRDMDPGCEDWIASLPGGVSTRALPLLREIFDAHGPLSPDELNQIFLPRMVDWARDAFGLVVHDLKAGSDLEPPPFEHRRDQGVWVAYWGQYATHPIFGLSQTEVTVEVADFMQEQIVKDLWSGWPVCPAHSGTVLPQVVDAAAVWLCRAGDHRDACFGA